MYMLCAVLYHTIPHIYIYYYTYTIPYTLHTHTVHHGRSPRVGGTVRSRPQAAHPRPGLRCPVPRVYKAGHPSAPVPLLDHC